MFVLFEEAGKFLAGRVLSETDASLQVELDSGKRVKVKSANALLKFEKPAPAELVAAGQKLGADIELDLAWEFAGEDEFSFADMARDYFSSDASKPASVEQQAAALFRLFEAPHYFRRAGKGRFKKAPAEILQQALAAIEKKKQLAAQITDVGRRTRCSGSLPGSRFASSSTKSCFGPTRTVLNTRRWSRPRAPRTRRHSICCKTPVRLPRRISFTGSGSCLKTFRKARLFRRLQAPAVKDELPLADVRAFSIDDSSTTEIDDALSVQGLGSGTSSRWASTSLRPGWPCSRAALSTRLAARGFPPCTCRVTS